MKLTVRTDHIIGKIKPMNAVNNGPAYTEGDSQDATNLPACKAANIPFARTHDVSIDYNFGGEHTVDVLAVFPDFDADPRDPASYDVAPMDQHLCRRRTGAAAPVRG